MEVKLLAHTQLSENFRKIVEGSIYKYKVKLTDGQAVALSAIRTCYSHNRPSEIIAKESDRYFGRKAKDGQKGTDADRLIRHIINSGHTSTMEHITFTFALEGVSRSLLAQLTRHRHFSYSVQSQRYVRLETDSKSGGFNYTFPPSVLKDEKTADIYSFTLEQIQEMYDLLRANGIPAEDARYLLPNAVTCNLVLTGNLRSILEFYSKRSAKQAQWEIRELAEKIKNEVIKVEPWTEPFFVKE